MPLNGLTARQLDRAESHLLRVLGYELWRFGPVDVRAKKHSCKIGTMPSLVVFCRAYRQHNIMAGAKLKVREAKPNSTPFWVEVTGKNDDGYFFAERI
jgi:hypothetical protein